MSLEEYRVHEGEITYIFSSKIPKPQAPKLIEEIRRAAQGDPRSRVQPDPDLATRFPTKEILNFPDIPNVAVSDGGGFSSWYKAFDICFIEATGEVRISRWWMIELHQGWEGVWRIPNWDLTED